MPAKITAVSFDHVVGAQKKRLRHRKRERSLAPLATFA
jgi:hypothetical protein